MTTTLTNGQTFKVDNGQRHRWGAHKLVICEAGKWHTRQQATDLGYDLATLAQRPTEWGPQVLIDAPVPMVIALPTVIDGRAHHADAITLFDGEEVEVEGLGRFTVHAPSHNDQWIIRAA